MISHELVPTVLEVMHESITGGHLGVKRTLASSYSGKRFDLKSEGGPFSRRFGDVTC